MALSLYRFPSDELSLINRKTEGLASHQHRGDGRHYAQIRPNNEAQYLQC